MGFLVIRFFFSGFTVRILFAGAPVRAIGKQGEGEVPLFLMFHWLSTTVSERCHTATS